MKTQKKNRPVAAPKTELSVEEGLAVLKDIHQNLESLNAQMSELSEKGDMDGHDKLQRQFNLVCSQFNYFLAQLPPVKFDDRHGEYFVGRDERSDREVYRVKISRTYAGYADIPAESEGAARLAAMILYGQRGVEMKKVGKQPTVEIVGVPVTKVGK